mgnify:CR=1 FL=1
MRTGRSTSVEAKASSKGSQIDSWTKLSIAAGAFVFIVALAIRTYHFGEMPVDRLPDSYHRWLIAQLTASNDWAYTDLKPTPNNTIVWLPLFQYIVAMLMYATGSSSILVPRLVSLIFGSLACLIVYKICIRLYQHKWLALVGGLLIAFQPWHVDFSVLGVAESVSSFLIVVATYFFICNKPREFGVFSFLAALCSYETWVVIAAEVALGAMKKGWRGTRLLCALIPLPLTIIGWSAWSQVSTGNPFNWITSTLYAMYPLGWEIHLVNPSILLFYVNNLLVMTFFIFFVGFVFGLLKGGNVRAITATMLAAVVLYSFAHYVGLDFGDQSRVILLLPLLAVVAPSAFPKFSGGKLRRMLIILMLLLVLVIPYLSQIWIFPRKVYIVHPEYRAGEALGQVYEGGRILSDSPIAVYASKIETGRFITYEKIRWYLETRNDEQLVVWLRNNDVKYLVWQKTNQTLGHEIFPFLAEGEVKTFGDATFTPIYEDSFRTGHWEHSSQYRIPDVFIYRIDYS